MFLTELFGFFSLSAFAMWGFLMAFFFNIFVYALGIKRETTLLLSSFVMMVSYTLSDYFYTWLSLESELYLDWALYDFSTIFVLVICYYWIKKTTPSFLYIVCGLTINAALSLLIYYDLNIAGTQKSWVLWDIYTFSVNITDFTMIVVLIVDRDILGLHKIKNKLFKCSKKRSHFSLS